MQRYIAEALNSCFEFFIIYIYMNNMLTLRVSNRIFVISGYIISSIAIFLIGLMTSNALTLISITCAMLLLLAQFYYNTDFLQSLFVVCIFAVLVFVSEVLLLGLLSVIGLGCPESILNNDAGRILGMISTKMIYFWLTSYTSKLFIKKNRDILDIKHWILIILTPLISVLILILILFDFIMEGTSFPPPIFLVAVLGLLYLNWSVFDFIESYSAKLRLTLLEQIILREEENYKVIAEAHGNLSRLKHDIKNQMKVMQQLIENNDKFSVKNQIGILEKELERYGAICYSGNPYIDSIINVNVQTAKACGVLFSVKYMVSQINLDAIELMRILGNALDNSIEACLKVTYKNPFIDLSITQKEEYLTVVIKNSSEDVDIKNLITQKKNKSAHGIGLKSIEISVQKLNGIMEYSYFSGVFTLKMVLYNSCTEVS